MRAVEAGADVILMPASVRGAIDGIVRRRRARAHLRSRADRSIRPADSRRPKRALGLDTPALGGSRRSRRTRGIPAPHRDGRAHRRALDHAPEERRGSCRLRGTRVRRVCSRSRYRRASDVLAGRYFNSALRDDVPAPDDRRARPGYAGRSTTDSLRAGRAQGSRRREHVRHGGVRFRAPSRSPRSWSDFVERLREAGRAPHRRVVRESLPGPDFPDVQAYMLAWNGSEASQRAAARALFGQVRDHGTRSYAHPPALPDR